MLNDRKLCGVLPILECGMTHPLDREMPHRFSGKFFRIGKIAIPDPCIAVFVAMEVTAEIRLWPVFLATLDICILEGVGNFTGHLKSF